MIILFVTINDYVLNLDHLRAAYKSEHEGYDHITTYYVQICIFARNQSISISFSDESERDKAFLHLQKQTEIYNRLKYPTQQVLLQEVDIR